MKKVIVRLGNGLGNQMFTYAAAYCFAKKNNAQLYIDDESGFYKRHKYELYNFNISAERAEKKYKFVGVIARAKRNIFIKMNKFMKDKKFLIEKKNKEKFTHYDSNHFDINFNNIIYFEGYYQSENYYKPEIKNILKELSFKKKITDESFKNKERIINSNSVSIHLRENKFLKDENHSNLNKLNEEFFENNIKQIKKGVEYFDKKIKEPKYFVWSNNITKINDLFPKDKFTIVEENSEKDPTYDLYLMSLCKNFILSPSTFHYWAAQLSTNYNKICLSPFNIKNKSGYYGFSNNKNIRASWWV